MINMAKSLRPPPPDPEFPAAGATKLTERSLRRQEPPRGWASPSHLLGVHALGWVGDTAPASVDYAVAKTTETGYDLLELSLPDTANLDVAAARRRLTDAGLRVVCSRWVAFDADIFSEDFARHARTFFANHLTAAGVS